MVDTAACIPTTLLMTEVNKQGTLATRRVEILLHHKQRDLNLQNRTSLLNPHWHQQLHSLISNEETLQTSQPHVMSEKLAKQTFLR